MARIFNAVRAENTPPRHARGDFKQALRAVFWTAPAQTIAQGKITRTDIGAKYLITVYLFTLQMGIVPTRSFHGPRGLGGRFLLNDRIVYAQVNGGYPYTTVANFYYVAIRSGLWEKIRTVLVERVRTDAGRNPSPSYAIIDSQSVKTTYAAEERGIDGGKNKKAQTAHRSGYYGESAGGGSSCCQYT